MSRYCIVQVSHAHPPLAAAVFNCYQMYSKASHKQKFPHVHVKVNLCCFKGPLHVCTEVLPKIELHENEIIHVMRNW